MESAATWFLAMAGTRVLRRFLNRAAIALELDAVVTAPGRFHGFEAKTRSHDCERGAQECARHETIGRRWLAAPPGRGGWERGGRQAPDSLWGRETIPTIGPELADRTPHRSAA